MKRKYSSVIQEFLFALLTASAVLLICSKSSPLYPLNDWVDANTYLTVGRGMLQGKVPYRDLYEQKGPFLYFIHALAASISSDSFLGVWLIETVAAALFLYETALFMRSCCGGSRLWALPVIAVMIYASQAFCHGDSAEELCLPLTMGAYMIGHRAVTDSDSISGREWFLLGAAGGCILWVKFTFLGIFAAVSGAMALCGRRSALVRGISIAVTGMAAMSLPVLLYYGVNGAVDELFSVYFYDNLFRYGDDSGFSLRNITDGLNFSRVFMGAVFWTVCAEIIVMLLRKKYREAAYYCSSVIIMTLSVFGGHRSYQYYPLAMAVFLPQAAAELISAAQRILHSRNIRLPRRALAFCSAATLTAGIGISLKTCRNVYLMGKGRDELPQYQFAELIEAEGGGKLLNYGFIDGGFYLAAGQVPEFRYFCMNNMDIPEMRAAQEYYVRSGRAKYVVVRSESPQADFPYPGYDLIASRGLSYYDKYFYYFLYEFNEKCIIT